MKCARQRSPRSRKWSVVHRKPAVVIAPLTREGKFVLIREERIPIRAAIWSMPAGQIDESLEPDEAAVREVARRELREETGYELVPGAELVPLGHYFTSPGFTDEHCYFFLAARCGKPRRAQHDATEAIIDCREFSAEVLREMIAEGEIRDANTPQHLGPAGGARRDFSLTMKLRDIFNFRDPPESETSKPFLEHLEDLRWTIVKMAITLVVAMILCFAFRHAGSIMQRPLSEVGARSAPYAPSESPTRSRFRFTSPFMPELLFRFRFCFISWPNLFCRL